MKYEELEECKENEAQKDYEALAQNLIKEVAINLMRVSNVYTDKKYDPYKSYKQVFSYFYGKNKNLKKPEKMKEYTRFATEMTIINGILSDTESEDTLIYKKEIKNINKIKKELIEKMNNIDENVKN